MAETEEETSGPIHRTPKDQDGTTAGAWEPRTQNRMCLSQMQRKRSYWFRRGWSHLRRDFTCFSFCWTTTSEVQPREALWGPSQSVAHSRPGREWEDRKEEKVQNEAVGVYLWFLVTVLNTSRFHLAMPETHGLLSHGLAT